MQLGQMIVKMRKDYGLTQDDFAQKFNVTRQTVSNWENEKSYPDLLTLVRISDEFDCSLDVMLKENNAVTEDLNKKIKYGEESALIGGNSFHLSIYHCNYYDRFAIWKPLYVGDFFTYCLFKYKSNKYYT